MPNKRTTSMKSRKNITLLLILLFPIYCLSQDYIYLKDSTIQKGKILEVNVDKIKYQKIEIPNGPLYEINKANVSKIQYSNGYIDYLDNVKPVKLTSSKGKNDSINFSMIYIVFNDGYDQSQIFPIYFNDHYIYRLKNHMRLAYKIESEGILRIERIWKKKRGPTVEIIVEHGKQFGITIEEPFPQGLDPNKRFAIYSVSDSINFHRFLNESFNGFKPFKKCDLKMEEDRENPIIQ
jgi:hypothetical protein